MKATLLLRAEHRNIEQALAILGDLYDLRPRDFEPLAASVLAHLDVEEHIIYPAFGRTSAQHFAVELADHACLRAAIAGVQEAVIDRATLRRRIADLALAFSAHVLRQDGVVYSRLEEVSSERGLEDLAQAVAAYRYAIVPAYLSSAAPRSAAE
jgi:hypothetical protein